MNRILLIACALVISTPVNAKQVFENPSLDAGLVGWELDSGDAVAYASGEGHLTTGGSARVTGSVDGMAAIASACVDVSDWVYFSPFTVKASVQLPEDAGSGALAGISVENFSDLRCSDLVNDETRARNATPGEWTRVEGDFALLSGARSIRVVLFANGVSSSAGARFDDVTLLIDRRAQELFENPSLSDNMQGWLLYWGDFVEYDDRSGHLTPEGAIRTEGQAVRVGVRGAWTGIRSQCIDVSERSPLDQYLVAASARPDADATDPEMGIHVDYYTDTDCTDYFSRSLYFGDAKPSKWARMEATFMPPAGTKGLIVRIRSTGVSDKGGALFDDLSLSLTQAVRQVWLIGVGEIDDRRIEPFEMQYTRGGLLGGRFDPASIERHSLVDLEIEFQGCNQGLIRYRGDGAAGGDTDEGIQGFEGSYPIMRLAQNESVLECEEQGFENMAGRNGWMAGYWFGGLEREGEGFVIDVLAGGEQAVVTWYTYMPDWGVDSPQ